MKNLSKYLVSNEDIESSQTTIFGETQEIDSENAIASTAGDLTEVTQIEGSPVEEVPIADDAITPIDFDTEVNILEPLAEQARVEDAAVALEAYRQLIKDAGPDGISRQAAAFMAVGMAQIDKALGIEKSQFTAALESYDSTPRSAIQRAAEVSVEAIGEKLKEAGKKAIEIIKKIIAILKQKIKEFDPKLIALDMRISRTLDDVKSLKTSNLKKDEVVFRPSQYQMAGNKFVGNDPRIVTELVNYLAGKYTTDLKHYNQLVIKDIKSSDDSIRESIREELFKFATEALGSANKELPGNQVIKLSFNNDSSKKWVLENDKDLASNDKEVTVDVRPVRTIIKHLETLHKLTLELKNFNKTDLKINEQTEKALENWNPDEANGLSADSAGHIIKFSNIDNSDLVNYLAKCISAQYSFIIKHELAAYGKEVSKAPENDEK